MFVGEAAVITNGGRSMERMDSIRSPLTPPRATSTNTSTSLLHRLLIGLFFGLLIPFGFFRVLSLCSHDTCPRSSKAKLGDLCK